MKSASCRANACTRWSRQATSRSIWLRSRVFMLSFVRFQFANGSGRIAKELAERRAHSGFRPRAFEQNAVKDFHLIKMVAFRFKELPSLLNRRFNNRIVIFGERYVGSIRFEKILG